MAKLKNPLLSLDAHGSVGKVVSFTQRRSQNIVEKKPELPYFLTLPVQYQRWLYEDYCAYWNTQSTATKRAYASQGVRHHLTGFQYWMKYHLTNLPDIVGYWKLDDNTHPTTPDSSRNGHTATIIGCTPAVGQIDSCLLFDGINDMVTVPHHPSFTLNEFTLVAFLHPAEARRHEIITKMQGGAGFDNYEFMTTPYPFVQLQFQDTLGAWHGIATTMASTSVITGQMNFVAVAFRRPIALFCINGNVESRPLNFSPDPSNTDTLIFGAGGGRWTKGLQDHIIIYNRALEASELILRSGRRWP